MADVVEMSVAIAVRSKRASSEAVARHLAKLFLTRQ